MTLVSRFEEIVRRFPSNIALDFGDRTISYQELDSASEQVANFLLTELGPNAEPIAVLLSESSAYYAAILGILKAGKFYVPVDPSLPDDRNRHILIDSTTRLILTETSLMQSACLRELFVPRMYDIGEVLTSDTTPRQKPLVGADALCYLIYTSGSTGQPKGVAQTHQNIVHNCMMQTQIYGLRHNDRLTQVHSLSVMGAVRATYNALLNGAALCPFDLKAHGLAELRKWLATIKASILHMTSSSFRASITNMQTCQAVEDIRLLILGGEAATQHDFDVFRQRFSDDAIFCTGLGSTETCTVRMLLLNKQSRPITRNGDLPLGYAMPDIDVILVSDTGSSVPVGDVGEIVVHSRFVSPGYWNSTTRDLERLSDDHRFPMGDMGVYYADGCLAHLGRKDFQVKIRGYRIETREVEVAIGSHSDIVANAVRPWKNEIGQTQLACYFVSKAPDVIDGSNLKSYLATRVPSYMIPSLFHPLDALPMTPTGKINFAALPDPDFIRAQTDPSGFRGSVSSLDYREREIREVIADSLIAANVYMFARLDLRERFLSGADPVHTSQLEMDSLSLMEVCMEIEVRCEVSITPEEFVEFQTLEVLAKRMMELIR